MKLIVGLGNKGRLYEKTRHNIGFMVIDALAKKHNIVINKEMLGGKYGELIINNQKAILLKPQKYINLSGEVIKSYIDYYNINIDDILIVHDDLDLRCESYKLKKQGGTGGHNGLKDIEQNLKTKNYKRIKIGISNDKNSDTKKYVLSKFNKEERKIIERVISEVTNIIEEYFYSDFNYLMNKYNTN